MNLSKTGLVVVALRRAVGESTADFVSSTPHFGELITRARRKVLGLARRDGSREGRYKTLGQ